MIVCSLWALGTKLDLYLSANLDKLRYIEKCGKTLTTLYEKHIGRVLAGITTDALTWSIPTPDRCLLECAMLHSGKHVHVFSFHTWKLLVIRKFFYKKFVNPVSWR